MTPEFERMLLQADPTPDGSPLASGGAAHKDEHGFLFSKVGDELKFNPYEAIKSFMAYRAPPGALSSSGDDAPVKAAADVAGWLGTSGLGLNWAGQVPQNALGVFGGRLARTADHAALARAEEMAAKGADRKDIWDNTGWFQGADGKWRFEIDDSKMGFAVKPTDWIAKPEPGKPYMAPNVETAANVAMADLAPTAPLRMKRLFTHDELQKAYPTGFSGVPDHQHQEIMSTPVKLLEGETGPAGVYTPEFIGLHQSLPPGTAKSTALHEMQHAVQGREDFARGASSSALRVPPERINQLLMGIDADKMIPGSQFEQEIVRAAKLDVPGFSGKTFDDLRHHVLLMQMRGVLPADMTPISSKISDLVARNAYRNAAGEVEARNVQTRMSMSPDDRRARPPWETEDVPRELQSVVLPPKKE